MIYPSLKLIKWCLCLGSIWLVFGLLRQFKPSLDPIWIFPASASLLILIAVLFDWLISRSYPYVNIARSVATTLPVGKKNIVTLRLQNPRPFDLTLSLYDYLPASIKMLSEPISVELKESGQADIKYEILPIKRGDAEFTHIDVVAASRFGLWNLRFKKELKQNTKIYPDFASITQLANLVHEQQGSQMGLHLKQKRGEGMEFHQLRDFRQGDSIRRIDWKASSRMQKLIAKGYQDERDQEIVFLLDCGRRLHTKDEDLGHFDHCLNALLLMAYVALSKGDRVGFMTFAGQDVWCPAQSGSSALSGLIQNSYHLQSTIETSDYLSAATELLGRQKRRALVVLLSNFQSEDKDDLKSAIQLMKKKNLVIAASLRESYIDNCIETPVSDFESALEFTGASQLLMERDSLVNELKSMGVYLVDSLANELPIQLVNQYLALKRAGLC